MNTAPNVSIIIVNYNTLQMTQECIESVFAHTKGVSFEVILVDNASTDGSREVFACDERIKYLYNTENIGFGKANNTGFELASGEYVLLLNSDTLLLNDAVTHFYQFVQKSSDNIACIGTILKDKHLQPHHSYGRFPTYGNTIAEWIIHPICHKLRIPFQLKKYDYHIENKSHIYNEVEYITGAALFIKRSIAEQYGLFCPDYFMYYEETDMQYRYRQHGLLSVVIDTPQIIHFMEGSAGQERRIAKKKLPLKSLFLYFRKHRDKVSYKLFTYFFLSLYIPQILISPYKWDDKKELLKAIASKNFF